ncbi:MAG TPA: FAD binding domain-containing protein [Ktedonobacterales bacterium]
MNAFEHTAAETPREAVALLAASADHSARLIAGGTDLLTLMKAGIETPRQLIDLKPARGDLRYLRFDPDGTLRLGALTTLAEVERHPEIAVRLPILTQAVRDAATPQLRAAATIAGNLLQRNRCWYYRGDFRCWLKGGDECFARDGQNQYQAIFEASPCVAVHPSDLAPALLALDAGVLMQGPAGARVIPLEQLFAAPTEAEREDHRLGADEVITELHVPPQPEGASGAYLKAMERQAWSFALASVAAQLSLRDGVVVRARLVLGGVANVPWRVRTAEDALMGQPLTAELAATAAERALTGATPLAHNGYKVPLARELLRRAILQAAGALASGAPAGVAPA